MNETEKQIRLREFLFEIDSSIGLKFSMSKRYKRTLGTASCTTRAITITRACFKYILDSMKSCILHELAHIYQQDITGDTGHNKQFGEIRDMLIEDYATREIMLANTSKTLAMSEYILDEDNEINLFKIKKRD